MNNADLLALIAKERRESEPAQPQRITVSQDRDQEGRLLAGVARIAKALAASLNAATRKVRVVNLPETQDVRVKGALEVKGISELSDRLSDLVALEAAPKGNPAEKRAMHAQLVGELKELRKSLASLDVRPEVRVQAPEVNVSLSPLLSQLSALNGRVQELLDREVAAPAEPPAPEPEVTSVNLERTRDGKLESMRVTYSDGTVKVASGFRSDMIRVESAR
jgi:hypothetical protein